MRRTVPSTAALTMFESAARHQSFTKAADELAVTQSAVCRQIAALEGLLGVKLFRRSQRGVSLTEAGATYSRQVSERLDGVERDTLDLMAKGGRGAILELGVVPTFATKWLLPRLPDFMALHPDITVNLTVHTRPFLFEGTPISAAISAGEQAWPGTESVFLMHEHMVPMASPHYLAAHTARAKGIDWGRCQLLQQSTRPYAWRQWFAACNLQVEGDMAGPRFELFSMQIAAAIHGLGIALVPRMLVEEELGSGLLVAASAHAHHERSYRLIYPSGGSENTALAHFSTWLDGQARVYREASAAAFAPAPARQRPAKGIP